MRNITRESIQSDLDALLPELRGPLAAAIDDNDDGGETLWFIVLSETFHPMLTASLESADKASLLRCLDFLELMNLSTDDYVRELGIDAVELLVSTSGRKKRAILEGLAGPATRSVYKKTLPYFGLPED